MLNTTGPLHEYISKEVLRAWGIPIPEGRLTRTVTEALEVAEQIGYPVALKVQAAELVHKTEVGGIMLDVNDPASLSSAYKDLYERIINLVPAKQLDGILVETMAAPGIEVALGIRRDPTWGPIMLVGLGGIWIEVLRDIVVGPAPLNEQEALELIKQLRAYPLLIGVRGRPPSDLASLAKVMVRLGRLALAHVDTVEEIDLNPLILYPIGKGLLVVDATIICSPMPDPR
jgi:succinyl-CoA synthetase beta subunit